METQEKITRGGFLKKLFGKQGGQVQQALEQGDLKKVNDILDKLGVARKTVIGAQSGKLALTGYTQYKGMIEDAVAGIQDVLTGLTDEVPDGLAQEVVAMVISALAEESPAEETEPEPEDEDTEQIPLEELMGDDEDDDEDEQFTAMSLTKQYASVAKELRDTTSALGELVAYVGELASKNSQLEARVKALEKLVAGKPKRASKANETFVDDEVAEAMKQEFVAQDPYTQRLAKLAGLKIG